MHSSASVYLNILGLVVVLMFVAWISHYFVQKLFNKQKLDKFYSVSSVVFQVLGSIAGIMQAFVVVSFWNDYQSTTASAHQEVENMTVTYRNASMLTDSPEKKLLLASYKKYVVSVIQEEVPGHSVGESLNINTQIAMGGYWEAMKNIGPLIQTPGDQVIFQILMVDANAAAKLRQHRINEVKSSDATLLWVVLIASSLLVMVVMGTLNVGQREGVYYLLSFALAFIFALMIAVSLDYSNPYEGTTTISKGIYGELMRFVMLLPN